MRHLIQLTLSFLIIITICLSCCTYAMAETAPVEVSSEGAILMEASTGTVLFQKDQDKQLRPASVTKIMTLLLIFEALENGVIHYEDMVTMSEHAAGMGGSQVYLEANEQQTVDTMLKCICIASANDASVAMAEFVAGSEEDFVARMNEKAAELGMINTHFVNCCGLDADGHITSAMDVAIMSRELINKYPEIHNYTTIWMDEFEHTNAKGVKSIFQLSNTNKLISTYPYATGLKTGSTSIAKYSVSATATKDGITLIAVVMADKDYKVRFTNAQKLLDYGFANCQIYKDDSPTPLAPISVKKGTEVKVKLHYDAPFQYVDTTGADMTAIKTKLTIPKSLKAPIDASESIGNLDYYLGDVKIGTVLIYPDMDIGKISYSYCLKEMLYSLLP